MTGKPPTSCTALFASLKLLHEMLLGIGSPMLFINEAKELRFSEASMADKLVPRISTPKRLRTPCSASSEQRLRAV